MGKNPKKLLQMSEYRIANDLMIKTTDNRHEKDQIQWYTIEN